MSLPDTCGLLTASTSEYSKLNATQRNIISRIQPLDELLTVV
jgi:hypothetical protein